MSDIIKFSAYDEQIDKSDYFNSLFQVAVDKKLIPEAIANDIMLGLAETFISECKRYTRGESSSLRTEIANEIMASVMASLNYYFKKQNNAQAVLEILNTLPFNIIYHNSEEAVQTLKNKIRLFYGIAKKTRILSDNIFYNTMLDGELRQSVKNVLMESYFLHKPVHFGYRLSLEITDLSGIEFLFGYLKSLITENRICCRFIAKNGGDLFMKSPQTKELPINIYEHYLKFLLLEKSKSQKPDFLASEICAEYGITNPSHMRYLELSVCKIANEVFKLKLIL